MSSIVIPDAVLEVRSAVCRRRATSAIRCVRSTRSSRARQATSRCEAGETQNASIAWSLPQGGPYNPSPIVYGDFYYTLFDRGFFTCHDAKTGKEIYTKVRLDPTAGGFTASPWAYNGKLFAMSEDGVTYVIQAGPEFKVIGRNSLDEFTMASPAIHRDSLLIRTATTLYKIAVANRP